MVQVGNSINIGYVKKVAVFDQDIVGISGSQYFIFDTKASHVEMYDEELEFKNAWSAKHPKPVPELLEPNKYFDSYWSQHTSTLGSLALAGLYLSGLLLTLVSPLYLMHLFYRRKAKRASPSLPSVLPSA